MKPFWGALLVLSLVLMPSAMAQTIDLDFIPDKISANSGFILVTTPSVTDESIRMNWFVGDTINGYGLLPRQGETWFCYFSNTDEMSTCGPSPFMESTEDHGIPYELEISMTNSTGLLANKTEDVTVGGIPISPKANINYSTNEVYMIVSILGGKYADSVSYRVYNDDLSALSAGYSPMEIDLESEKWTGTVSLSAKTYYIAFKATSGSDFGGGVVRVSLGEEPGETGIVNIDDVDISVLVDSGDTYQRGDYRITNPANQTISGIYATVPSDLRDYVEIGFQGNATLDPYESEYYTVTFRNLESGLSINTKIPVYSSGGTKIAEISMTAEISVKDSGTDYGCDGKDDGEFCIGGICCDEECIKKAECCDSTDCVGGSCVNYRCTGGAECPSGSECKASCDDDETYTGTCAGGVCCKPSSSGNECENIFDGASCTGGICCNDICVTGAECCTDFECDTSAGEVCESYSCVAGTPSGDISGIINIILIIAVVGVAGFGIYYYLTKIRGKKTEEEEGEEGEEDAFEDEEFY